ncbi:MAG: hypothetical protein JNM76_04175 [Betaproteobacteria bacterium]|nr:hypothetical protein [Betaproteobacteria bacterium]
MSQQVLHSTNAAGRHWLTMATSPPLQIGPVAPNHCRIGYHILQAVFTALDEAMESRDAVPEEIDIRMDDDSPVERVALPMLPGPANWGGPDDADEDPTLFLTVRPVGGEDDDAVDAWIVPLADALGLEPEPAIAEGGYERAMQAAKDLTQAALPVVRERFLERGVLNVGRPAFGFKIGLVAEGDGTEWVWVQPKSWSSQDRVTVTLESEPFAVPGRKLGDVFDIAATDIADYLIYHPKSGEREGGFTDRIAADYGLFLPS